ncbi:MAG: 6-bladed beta-propeller [Candidatus Eisenbacteria bacterium]|nr:6-bladed beta-propeller [Candidatus Eisenbacteria bacterium]
MRSLGATLVAGAGSAPGGIATVVAAPDRRGRARHARMGLLLFLCGLLLCGCAREWEGTRTVEDGVVWVRNPAAPLAPPQSLEMHECWRLPSESPSGELRFGAIADLQQDERGVTYLLDSQLGAIHLVSPDGHYLRSIGRQGEGPGEFQWPMGLVLGRAEERIGVLDAVGHKIVFLDRQGVPGETWRAAGFEEGVRFSPLYAWEVPAGKLIVYQTRERDGRLITFGDAIGLFGQDHALRHTLTEKSRVHHLDEAFLFDEVAAESFSFLGVRDDGTLYLAPRFDEYRIEVYDPRGALTMVIERPIAPVARTGEQIADLRASWSAFYERVRDLELRISPDRRVILALRPRPAGALWVETSRGWADAAGGTAVIFDEIDAQGRFVRQVALRGEIDPWNDYIYLFGDRLLRLTSGFEATQGALGASRGEQDAHGDQASSSGADEASAGSGNDASAASGSEAPAAGSGGAPALICYDLVPVAP